MPQPTSSFLQLLLLFYDGGLKVGEFCSLVPRMVGEDLSFVRVSIEFSASSLLFLGCGPILFCGYDFKAEKVLLEAGKKNSVEGHLECHGL